MLTPLEDVSNLTHGSKKMVEFKCSCGNVHMTRYKNYTTGHVKTCGKCKRHLYQIQNLRKQKFGMLTVSHKQKDVETTSNSKILWKCDCGKEKLIAIKSVIRGLTKSCHREGKKPPQILNNMKTLSEWSKILPLTIVEDNMEQKVSHGSGRKFKFKCHCEGIFVAKFSKILSGHVKTCGKCKYVFLERNHNFGKLVLIDEKFPMNIHYGTDEKFLFRCDCGNEKMITLGSVYKGSQISCGDCNLKSTEWWLSQQFGKLRVLKINQPLKLNSITTIECLCDCGDIKMVSAYDLSASRVISCGCVSNVSQAQLEIAKYIESLGFDTQYGDNELSLGKYKFDIYVKSKNLIIEYNGLYWHSTKIKNNHTSDYEKYKFAKSLGYSYLCIFEDEWIYKQNIIKNIIRQKLGVNKPKFKFRPQQCKIALVSNSEVKEFYNNFHYIGSRNNKYNVAIYYDNKIIACMSLAHPTRQKISGVEITRMVSDFNYRIYGVWSFLLKFVRLNLGISHLVSYSDNRISSGDIYQKLNFKKTNDVRPDYYYIKGVKRLHKSALRKSGEEITSNLTEVQLRTQQGYSRIFDIGKIKWEYKEN